MKLNPETLDDTLLRFLAAWPVTRVQTMNEADYAELSNRDSFCYWLEYGTKNLGEIGDNSLTKFEFWRPKGEVEFKDSRFLTDGSYAWNANRGSTGIEAFNDVRSLIIQIITYAQNQNWEAIDKIPFHQIGKWKIAFVYSNKTLLPVYSKRALIAIAKGLGREFPYKANVSALQKFILQFKPDDVTIDVFAHNQYRTFAAKVKPNFYIIGSKYDDDEGNDVIPKINEFLKHSCVAIGFLGQLDFSSYMGAETEKIDKFIEESWKKAKPAWHKIRRYFKLLSQIKAGDIIAVKSHGAHNQLTIIAYAQVVEINGKIYEHNPHELGHHIHVEFLEKNLYNNLGFTYAETIHKLTPGKDKDKFYKIFGWYANPKSFLKDDEPLPEGIEENGESVDGDDSQDYSDKSEDNGQRGPIAAGVVKRIHNRIQNRFIKHLKVTYPTEKIFGEKQRIDARRENASQVIIYEIKPYMCAYSCTREAIGQLLDYSHQFGTTKEKRIVVVGPGQPDPKAQAFINSIRNNLNLHFEYLAFDEKNMTTALF